MTDLLQSNLYYLKENKKELFKRIESYLDTTHDKNCKLIINEDNLYNLAYAFPDETKLLYSDDESEIDQWLKQYSGFSQGKYDVVMYGLGLTHHLAKLIELNPMLEFYIFEPEIDIFVEALKVINIDQLLRHPQVKLLSIGNDEEDIKYFHILLNTYSSNKTIDVFIPFYTLISMDTIRLYYDNNYTFREYQLKEIGFELNFGTQPYRNSIRNLEVISKSTPVKALQDKFRECTALVVGAGPSLELDIPLIKENYDKFFIIAAGSSIQSLLHFGIKPHLIISMDPSEANGRVFRNIDTSSIPFIFVPQIYYGILKEEFACVFHAFFNNDPITEYLFSDINIDYKFLATNSVTGTAIQIAKYLGAQKIVLTGQDLSFPNENYYAEGATHLDTKDLRDTIVTSVMKVENVKGTTNRTNLSMRSTLEDIEKLISNISGVKFINTSSLGARIKGADFSPLSEVISTSHSSSYDFNCVRFINTIENINEYENLLDKIENFIKTCDYLISSNDNSLRIIRKIDELARRNPNKAMNLLAKLEQEFSTVTEHKLFLNIIPDWNRGLTRKYDQQVIKIESEPTIVGKARLINQIVVPYIESISKSFADLKAEFQELLSKLTSK